MMRRMMRRMRASSILALLVSGLLVGCGASGDTNRASIGTSPDGPPTTRQVGEVEVRGTALDARTGELLAGVRITGPGESRAVSDRHGRFVLHGLHEGDAGEVRGTLQDGRVDSVVLQPLAKVRIELVLRLAQPR